MVQRLTTGLKKKRNYHPHGSVSTKTGEKERKAGEHDQPEPTTTREDDSANRQDEMIGI